MPFPDKKRCIWVLAKYATAREQGFETRTIAIAREWVRAGRDVVILSSSANHFSRPTAARAREDYWFDGVRMVVLRTLGYRTTASIRRVLSWLHFEWRILRTQLDDLPRPDVIIVTSLSLFSVLNGARLARKFQVPWVFEVRDIWPLTLTEEGGFSRWHPLTLVMQWIERMGYRQADLTVGTMPNLAPHASAIAGFPINCACVPFGFDPLLAPQPVPAPPRTELQMPRDDSTLTVGYAGSMGIANALDNLIEAAVALREDHRFRFVLLGDGDLRATYMANTAGCPHVHWLGKVPREEVHAVLTQCDILYFSAHPSRVWDSGMSLNKLTDYLLAAKPILGSYSGFPSILDEAGCGEFLPAGDTEAIVAALNRYAAQPREYLEKMGAAGRTWLFEHRTWGHLANEYLGLLDHLPPRVAAHRT
jgi:glycosyltransferase involved in cell wall biosynthesis